LFFLSTVPPQKIIFLRVSSKSHRVGSSLLGPLDWGITHASDSSEAVCSSGASFLGTASSFLSASGSSSQSPSSFALSGPYRSAHVISGGASARLRVGFLVCWGGEFPDSRLEQGLEARFCGGLVFVGVLAGRPMHGKLAGARYLVLGGVSECS